MKLIWSLLAAVFVVISVCMGFLTWRGVSLRLAPIIKASHQGAQGDQMSYALALRLSSEFSNADYIRWRIDNERSARLVMAVKEQFEKLSRRVTIHSTVNQLSQCAKPCWVLEPVSSKPNTEGPIGDQLESLGAARIVTVQIISFDRYEIKDVSPACLSMQRMNQTCIEEVALHEQKRFLKDEKPYFFVKKYNLNDFYIFVERVSGAR